MTAKKTIFVQCFLADAIDTKGQASFENEVNYRQARWVELVCSFMTNSESLSQKVLRGTE